MLVKASLLPYRLLLNRILPNRLMLHIKYVN